MARRQSGATSSYLDTANWPSAGAHTVACWILVHDGTGGVDGIYGDVTTGSGDINHSIWLGANGSGQWQFQENNGGYGYTQSITLDVWTHLAMTNDGTTSRAYINGSQVNSAAFNPTGRANFQFWDYGFGNDIHVQDAYVISAALTAEEITWLMRRRRMPVRASSVYFYWPLDSNNSSFDYSGNGHNIVADNSVVGTSLPSTVLTPGRAKRIYIASSSGTAITATGRTNVTGAASITSGAGIVAAGTTQVTGSASITSAASLAASGTTNVTGSASLTASAGLVASGTTNVTGSASITSAAGLVASGTTNVTGAAAISSAASIVASGTTNVTGAADVNSGTNFSIAASGATQVSGSASLTAAAPLTAAGTTQVTGAAVVTSSAPLTAAGLTQTTGAAAFGIVIASGGTTQVTGVAVLTASAGVTAAGLVAVSGAAAFSGLGPTTIPDPDWAERRWIGALGARRRLRR